MTDHAQLIRDAVGNTTGYEEGIRRVAAAYQARDERIVEAGVRLGADRHQVQDVLDEASRPQAQPQAQAQGNGDLADQVATLARTVGQLVEEARNRFGFRVR